MDPAGPFCKVDDADTDDIDSILQAVRTGFVKQRARSVKDMMDRDKKFVEMSAQLRDAEERLMQAMRSSATEVQELQTDLQRSQLRVKELEEENAHFRQVSRIVALQNENEKLREDLRSLQTRLRQPPAPGAAAAAK